MNEIDNYNPRAQARLAKYAEYMWKGSEMKEGLLEIGRIKL